MTISRNPDWKNNVTLFAAGVKNSPNSFRTHAGYADQFRVKGEVERNPELRKRYLVIAIEEYKKSIAILEDTPPNWYNLGVCYYMIDEKENAKNAYKKTIALEASHKDALNNLGVIYFEKRQFAEAQECFEKVVSLDPRHGAAYGNLGAVEHNLGKYELALEHYMKSLELLPDNKNVRENLEKLRAALGR